LAIATISAKDASLLALIAERPERDSRVTDRIFYKLGSKAQQIAEALKNGPEGASGQAAETARGLHDWVKANRAGRKRRK
jgi:hypothetical protein